MAASPSRRVARGFLRSAAVFLAMTTVLLLGSEWIVRTYLLSPSHFQRDDELGLVGRPGAAVIESREGYSRTHLNSRGLPDSEARPHPAHRVLVVGDSYSEALHVPRKANYTSIVESMIDDIDVVNAGFGGFAPVQATVKAERLAEAGSYDVIVLQVSGRDLEDMFDASRLHLESGPEGVFRQVAPASYTRTTRLGTIKQWLMRRSALANYVASRIDVLVGVERSRLRAKWAKTSSSSVTAPDSLNASRSMRACQSLVDRLRALGSEVVLLYIPYIDYESAPPRLRSDAHHDFWRRFAQSSGVVLADPTDALLAMGLAGGTPAFGFSNKRPGRGHLNRVGHRIVGIHLAAAVETALDRRR